MDFHEFHILTDMKLMWETVLLYGKDQRTARSVKKKEERKAEAVTQ